MQQSPVAHNVSRRNFIGGSDARIIMGTDEAALLRLWKEKRGEGEPEDFSGKLIVQLGVVTEGLNRHWYERNTRRPITAVRSWSIRRAGPPSSWKLSPSAITVLGA